MQIAKLANKNFINSNILTEAQTHTRFPLKLMKSLPLISVGIRPYKHVLRDLTQVPAEKQLGKSLRRAIPLLQLKEQQVLKRTR